MDLGKVKPSKNFVDNTGKTPPQDFLSAALIAIGARPAPTQPTRKAQKKDDWGTMTAKDLEEIHKANGGPVKIPVPEAPVGHRTWDDAMKAAREAEEHIKNQSTAEMLGHLFYNSIVRPFQKKDTPGGI